jgi:hypothetical protein
MISLDGTKATREELMGISHPDRIGSNSFDVSDRVFHNSELQFYFKNLSAWDFLMKK